MDAIVTIALLIGAIMITAILGLISQWIDRKVTARIQWRVGPPWYQPLADLFKLRAKETIVPETARQGWFLFAPLLGLTAVVIASAILWLVNVMPGMTFVGDIIVVTYLLTVPSLAVVIGGIASGNPIGALGASREMKLTLAYELPFILAIVASILTLESATLKLSIISAGSSLLHVSTIIAFFISLLCVQAKLTFVPFDIPEAETEIMTGPYVDYSGTPLAIIHLTKALLLATLPIFIITVFWGGIRVYELPFVSERIPAVDFTFSIFLFILKYIIILVILILVKNTNPRLRIDQAVKFFWLGLTPLALIAVILAWRGF